jgi:RecA-family ATPase
MTNLDGFDDRDYDRAQRRYVPISGVEPTSPRWYWRRRLVRADLNILAGTQGVGKSQIAMWLAADATRRGETVLVISAEDSPTTTIAPRFIAANGVMQDDAGVPLLHIRRLDSNAFQLSDVDELREDIEMMAAKFVIIDPVAAFVEGTTDTHKDAHVRSLLAPLRGVAETTDCTVLLVMHLKKGDEQEAVNRVGGSIAWTAAPRSVLMVHRERDIDTGDTRLLIHAKCNVGPEQPTLEFFVDSVDYDVLGPFETSVVRWGQERPDIDSDVAFAKPDRRREKPKPELDRALTFLKDVLKDGPVLASDVVAWAEVEGIAAMTLRRARGLLGIVSEKTAENVTTLRLP